MKMNRSLMDEFYQSRKEGFQDLACWAHPMISDQQFYFMRLNCC